MGRFVGFGQMMAGLLGILFIISVIKTLVTQSLACFDVYRIEDKVHPKMFTALLPALAKSVVLHGYSKDIKQLRRIFQKLQHVQGTDEAVEQQVKQILKGEKMRLQTKRNHFLKSNQKFRNDRDSSSSNDEPGSGYKPIKIYRSQSFERKHVPSSSPKYQEVEKSPPEFVSYSTMKTIPTVNVTKYQIEQGRYPNNELVSAKRRQEIELLLQPGLQRTHEYPE